jgi:hypothetical protein
MMIFVAVLLKKYHAGNETKEDETGWSCDTFDRGTKLQYALFKASAVA